MSLSDTPSTPMNIMWIITDQQRWDTLSCYGQSICRTPHMDQLASQGTRFDQAYTVCPLSAPARTSMMTGLYPHQHRMWNNNDMFQWATRDVSDDVRMFSEDLIEQGYACGYSGKWHCGHDKVPSTFGFEGMDLPDYGRMFDNPYYLDYLKQNNLPTPEFTDYVVPERRAMGGTLTGPVQASPSYFLAEHAMAMLSRKSEQVDATGQPFCQILCFFGPHHPCFVPEPYASMYDPSQIEPTPADLDDLSGKPAYQKRFRSATDLEDCDWVTWQRARALYFGYTTLIDDQVGRVLDHLEALGRSRDTMVIFTSDHGDTMGSRSGGFDKGYWPYEEVYRVPMVIRAPEQGEAGAVCDQLVSNLDLTATVLDACGVSVDRSMPSRSLMPLVRDPRGTWSDQLFCQYHGNQYLFSQRWLRFDHYKFVFNPSQEDELYDLHRDPHELVNVIDDAAYFDVAEQARGRMADAIETSGDPLAARARWFLKASNSRLGIS